MIQGKLPHRNRRRAGFTLLEMILSLAIGLMLMSALYAVLSTQLNHSQAGRESIQEATLARSILARITSDILGSLGPYDPKQQAESNTATDATATTGTEMTDTVHFNIGVQGSGSQLMLCQTLVPRDVLGPGKLRMDPENMPKSSDLRRTTYWVGERKGLLLHELTLVTGSEIDVETPDADLAQIFAPEVKSISFRYWDGASWLEGWSSSEPGPDGDTPVGPPAAIEITLEILRGRDADGAERSAGVYRQIVTLPTGNNYSTQQEP